MLEHLFPVVYILFSYFGFGAASLRQSNPCFRVKSYILFVSDLMFDVVKQNLLAKPIIFQRLYFNKRDKKDNLSNLSDWKRLLLNWRKAV